MEWPSKELENYYYVFNKVYSITIKQKFPYVEFVIIDPEYFLEQIMKSVWSLDVKVYMCLDWSKKNEENELNLGEYTVTIMMNLQNMIEKPQEIGDRKIYPNLEINTSKYCKGLVEITYN